MDVSRRKFLEGASVLAAAAAVPESCAAGADSALGRGVRTPPRNRRPYSGLDWTNVIRVKTTSHGHCKNQAMLDRYLARGFGLITMSNYYPSIAWFLQ